MTNSFSDQNGKLGRFNLRCNDKFTLDFSERGYTDEDMEMVAKHVMTYKQCEVLLLHQNHITEKGVLHLAQALKNNTSLEKLNLGYNKIGDKGVEIIVESLLMSNNTLTKLHLQSNSITEVGAGHLAKMLRINRAMRNLGLDYNNIGDQGVKLLSSALSSTGNKACQSADSNSGSSLRALYLDANNITDNGVNYLANMLEFNRTLANLALGKNDISDLGARRLIETLIDHNTMIVNLNIFSNKRITDKSLDVFLKLFDQHRKFKMYKLYDCSFSADGQEKLQLAAGRIKGFKLLLEGDGYDYAQSNRRWSMRNSSNGCRLLERDDFDYSQHNRRWPMRNLSNTKTNSYEDWFDSRRKQFSDKNSNNHRVFDSIRFEDKCNSLLDGRSRPTGVIKKTTQPAILSTSDIHSDDPVSKCTSDMDLLTISADSSSMAIKSPTDTTPSTTVKTEKESNAGSEDAD